jgi:hypothetical protein
MKAMTQAISIAARKQSQLLAVVVADGQLGLPPAQILRG